MSQNETTIKRIEREIDELILLFKRRWLLATLVLLGLGAFFLPKTIVSITELIKPKEGLQTEEEPKLENVIPSISPVHKVHDIIAEATDLKIDFEGLKVGDCLENFYAGGTSRSRFRSKLNLNIKDTSSCPDKETVISGSDVINGDRSYILGILQFEKSDSSKFPKHLSLMVKKKSNSGSKCQISVSAGPKARELTKIYTESVDSSDPLIHEVSLPSMERIVFINAICGDVIVDDIVFSN